MMTEAELEQHLCDLYRGEDPPASLAARIAVRARAQRQPTRWFRLHAPWLAACAVMLAVCAVVLVGVVRQHETVAAQQAQVAQAQLAYALQITSGELNWAETHITRDLQAGQKGSTQR